ncbi:NAD(P)-dependent oxidoreductase [Lacisediminihabitans sp. G11-30]|uniref:NAD(P)-dependent oxidoreductase n=2 Tax=Lacisediminihabitans changchengi TaxID=2787634 RepID=A0A934SMU5_9MICO|nr:NAD(P)-dependent oxidoreductase [Lacisediminihabitans changchengi]
MRSIGVLGLGRMGGPIAARLAAAGWPVSGFDPRAARAPGGTHSTAGSARELAASVDVLITVLPGRGETAAVMPDLLAAMAPGAIWLDLTSGDPALSERLAAAGIRSVGAPMGGGPAEAQAGSLTLFVGGAETDVESLRPLLETIASRIERAGERPQDGQIVKLLANLLWFGQAVAVTEALLLGVKLGLTLGAMRDILPRSAGGSSFMTTHLDRLLAGDYAETFGLDRCVEELDTLAALAETASTPFALSTLVAGLHREALATFGPVDGELLVAKLLEQRAGIDLSGEIDLSA